MMDSRFLEMRRRVVAAAWCLRSELVLVGAGELIPIPGRVDQAYPFIAHSEYVYLADDNSVGGILAFDPHDGWIKFLPATPSELLLWNGASDAHRDVRHDFAAWLKHHSGRRVGVLGCPISGVVSDTPLEDQLRNVLNDHRRIKDDEELDRMRAAASVTRLGFDALSSVIAPGISERELAIELESHFWRAGAERTAFDTIVASGQASATLHHIPSQRRIRPRELVLIDAGAEWAGYASDVTRTYSSTGQFTSQQADLYAVVRAVQDRAIGMCVAGTPFRSIHIEACRCMAQGLIDLGILYGSVDQLVETGACTLFFPHGIGHLLGIGVRDVGIPRTDAEAQPPYLKRLRIDLTLQPGIVVTIEPGVYFNPLLLNGESRAEFHDCVDWKLVENFISCGGIRIEDNVHVTQSLPEVLTKDLKK